MTIFPASISFVPGTHRLVVQHATTRLAGPLSHAEAEGMLLRSLCFMCSVIFRIQKVESHDLHFRRTIAMCESDEIVKTTST